jgi:4-amino-4-deoxy-L-arabinose transferase-like glycosyltransferase
LIHPVPAGRARPGLRHPGWLVFLLALLLYLPDLGRTVVRREQELRVLLTARDMVWTGRWLDPHFRGEPRLRKPPLMYWLTGAIYLAGAPVHSAALSRLPSALAGVGFMLVLYGLGRRLVGRRRACAAALMAGASMIALRQGRLAETDMTLALFTTAALLSGGLALRGARPAWWLAAGLFVGLGFMTKGPAAVALPLAAWLLYALWRPRQTRPALRPPAIAAGLGIAVALAAPWYIWIRLHQDAASAAQLKAEVDTLLTRSHHAGPVAYYLYTGLQALLPWSPLLPFALWPVLRSARTRTAGGFLLLWFISTFAILTAISSKQIHYALLLVAPGALLMAHLQVSRDATIRRWRTRFTRLLAALLALAGLAALTLLCVRSPAVPWGGAALAVAGVACAGAAMRAATPDRRRLVLLTLAIAALQSPLLQADQAGDAHGTATRAVVQQCLAAIPREAPVQVCGPLSGSMAFYVDRPVAFAPDFTAAWTTAQPGTLVLASWRAQDRPPDDQLPTPPLATRTDRSTHVAGLRKPGAP